MKPGKGISILLLALTSLLVVPAAFGQMYKFTDEDGVTERVRFDGTVETPLDAAAVGDPARRLADDGVEALAIGFLILLSSTVAERVREFRHDPYRDIQR